MVQKLIEKNAEITLGYWGIRGLGQPIRFLLVAADVPFSEVRLGVLQDGTILHENQEGEDWSSVRSKLDMPFPNLPYLIDTSGASPVRLSQSNAILRYLARRFDFYGDSETDRIELDWLYMLSEYRSGLETRQAVKIEPVDYAPAMQRWLESKGV